MPHDDDDDYTSYLLASAKNRAVSVQAAHTLSDAVLLNDYSTPTFTRASTAFDPYNKVTAISGARRRRPFTIGGTAYSSDFIEGARTNLCIRSSDFNNWATKTDITVTSAALTPADGTGSADLITEGTLGTALAKSAAMTITAGRVVTANVRFKKSANNDWVCITLASDTMANGWRVWANINTGVVGTQSAIGTGAVAGTASLVSLGSGEYQLISSGMVSAAATACQIQVNSASADASTTSVNSAAYYAWAAQVEMMASGATLGMPSSYIATTTVSVTRAADALSTPYVLGQTGTIIAVCIPNRWSVDQDGGTGWRVWVDDQATISRVGRQNATTIIFNRGDAGGNEFTTATSTLSANVLQSLGMSWNSAEVVGFVDGVRQSSDTSLTPSYTTNTLIRIGSSSSAGASSFFGWVALLAWPRVLNVSELLALRKTMVAA